jgi:hypothetical protein
MNNIANASRGLFMAQYRIELRARYAWTQNEIKLDTFMQSVQATLYDGANTWNHDRGSRHRRLARYRRQGQADVKGASRLGLLRAKP